MKKNWIVIKEGRGYLHTEVDMPSLGCKGCGIYPLGNDPKIIKQVQNKYNCNVLFK